MGLLSTKKVFVTGGSGFIGGRLIETLVLDHRASVRALVHTAWSGALRMARFDIELIDGELTDPAAMEKATKDCEIVFHLAFGKYGTDEDQRRDTVLGTETLAKASIKNGVRRFIYVSTGAVYATAGDGVVDETSPRSSWGWGYSDAKLEAENLILDYCARSGLPAVIVQVAGVYGPWGTTFTVTPLKQLKAGRVALPNGGHGIVNATYVDDAVQGLLLAAIRENIEGEIFIIKGPGKITRREIYERYAEMAGCKDRLVSMSIEGIAEARQQQENRKHGSGMTRQDTSNTLRLFLPDAALINFLTAKIDLSYSKAQRVLAYAPQYPLDKGMSITERWARWTRFIT